MYYGVFCVFVRLSEFIGKGLTLCVSLCVIMNSMLCTGHVCAC